jgi:hypothetical protein
MLQIDHFALQIKTYWLCQNQSQNLVTDASQVRHHMLGMLFLKISELLCLLTVSKANSKPTCLRSHFSLWLCIARCTVLSLSYFISILCTFYPVFKRLWTLGVRRSINQLYYYTDGFPFTSTPGKDEISI